jgi:hypothetical protein
MNAEEIDELFEAEKRRNYDKMLEMLGIEKTGTAEDTIYKMGEEKFLELIMQKIESGDFEHFYSMRENANKRSFFYIVIEHTSKKDILKELVSEKEGKLSDYRIAELVKATKDSKYIQEYIEKNISKIGSQTVLDLVKATRDTEYIKSYIDNPEKIKSLGMKDSDIAALIIATQDPKYMKSIIADKEKQYVLGLDTVDKINIIIATKDDAYMDSEFEKPEYGISELDDGDPNKKIKLPSDMTIGIEIESEGKSSEYIMKMTDTLAKGWKCKHDGSLSDGMGVEVVSPVLSGTDTRMTKSIKRVCQSLEILGQTTSGRCGGHVHIGADYLKSEGAFENLVEIVGNTEEILYAISNAKGEKPRSGVGGYARPISQNIEKIADENISLDSQEDRIEFAKRVQGTDSRRRYFLVNFLNLGNNKNTIEFRLANGIVDGNTWIENINLFGGIIKASEDLAQIQAKPEEQRSEQEKKKISCLEQLKEKEISSESKLEALLELTIPEEDKDIYRERYDVNHKLIEEDKNLKIQITDRMAKKPIEISKNKIGKRVFTGEKAVTGQDYEKGAEMIRQDLERGTFDRTSA